MSVSISLLIFNLDILYKTSFSISSKSSLFFLSLIESRNFLSFSLKSFSIILVKNSSKKSLFLSSKNKSVIYLSGTKSLFSFSNLYKNLLLIGISLGFKSHISINYSFFLSKTSEKLLLKPYLYSSIFFMPFNSSIPSFLLFFILFFSSVYVLNK